MNREQMLEERVAELEERLSAAHRGHETTLAAFKELASAILEKRAPRLVGWADAAPAVTLDHPGFTAEQKP